MLTPGLKKQLIPTQTHIGSDLKYNDPITPLKISLQ